MMKHYVLKIEFEVPDDFVSWRDGPVLFSVQYRVSTPTDEVHDEAEIVWIKEYDNADDD